MKTARTLLAAAWLCVATVPCLAAPSPDASTSPSAAAQQVQIDMQRAVRDLDKLYEMSTGRTMRVTAVGNLLRVSYGRRGDRFLHFDASKNAFVSRDGQLSLSFDLDPTGAPENVRFALPGDWK